MTRALYRFLIRLHPASFRTQFGDEMLCIFDESAASHGAVRLLADAAFSVVRQWMSRPVLWKLTLACAGAWFQVLAALQLPVVRTNHVIHSPETLATPQFEQLIQLTILTIFGILALTVAMVVWTTSLCRRRR